MVVKIKGPRGIVETTLAELKERGNDPAIVAMLAGLWPEVSEVTIALPEEVPHELH